MASAAKRSRTVSDDSAEMVVEICCFSETPGPEEDSNVGMLGSEPQEESDDESR